MPTVSKHTSNGKGGRLKEEVGRMESFYPSQEEREDSQLEHLNKNP